MGSLKVLEIHLAECYLTDDKFENDQILMINIIRENCHYTQRLLFQWTKVLSIQPKEANTLGLQQPYFCI